MYLLLDAGPMLDDPVAVRRLKELSGAPVAGRTTILTGVGDAVPAALRPEGVLFRPRPPDADEPADLLDRTAKGLAASGMSIRLSPSARVALLDSLRGLTAIEAERIITEHTVADGLLGDSDLPPSAQRRRSCSAPTRRWTSSWSTSRSAVSAVCRS